MAKQRQFLEVSVKTNHPHPLKSPDYLDPAGSIEDNSSNQYFIYEIEKAFNGLPFRLLDLGCAGGQFVVDIYSKGFPWVAVGIEGGNIYGMTKEFEEKECETGALSIARGAQNWKQYEGKCLFHADISKPFEILGQSRIPLQFNVITAYEFLEHPLPEEIPGILENVKKHLHTGGFFIGTINLSPGPHHRCGKPVEWWDNIFEEHGFEMYQYPFSTSPRTGLEYISRLAQAQSQNPNIPREQIVLRDETVVGTKALEQQLIDMRAPNHLPSLDSCNEYNYPFCAMLKIDQ
tara:strand:+ start:17312 stop:18181 length:870 start_codon:yes stop_codon:yes gene_type:complete